MTVYKNILQSTTNSASFICKLFSLSLCEGQVGASRSPRNFSGLFGPAKFSGVFEKRTLGLLVFEGGVGVGCRGV